jgi:hypothetical protein
MRDRARQRDEAVEPLADFLHQREGGLGSGMAAGAGRHRDQPVCALFDRLAGKAVVDDVMQHDAAPAVRRLVDVLSRASEVMSIGHLPLGAKGDVVLEPVVRLVDDLVDGERAAGRSGWARLCAASSSVIWCSHSSSWLSGRALSEGKLPTTPALHWAITSSGPEMMNSGEAMTGRRKLANTGAGASDTLSLVFNDD